MKKILFSFVFALVVAFGFGQNLDSLAVVREVDSLIGVSRALAQKKEFDKSLEVNSLAEKLTLEKLGRESAAYGNATFNKGRIFHLKSDYNGAKEAYQESLEVREKVLGKDNADYATSLNNLGIMYYMSGDYGKSEQLNLEAREIRGRVLGKYHSDYGLSVNTLGAIYMQLGDYEKAEPFFIESAAIREKNLGKNAPGYAMSLNNLGRFYSVRGSHDKAEFYLLEAKSILEKAAQKESRDYALVLNNLGVVYRDLNIYDKAEMLFVEAMSIREKTQGKTHSEYTESLNNLAILYKYMGEYKKSEMLYLESKATQETTIGKEHFDYAWTLNGLGSLYLQMQDYEKSEAYYLESKSIREKTLGKEHPDYAVSVSNLANCYYKTGNPEKARSLYQEANEIRLKTLGKENFEYLQSLNQLIIAYWTLGEYESVKSSLSETFEIEKRLIVRTSNYLSERELSSFTSQFRASQNRIFSFSLLQNDLYALSFDNSLLRKGFLLNTTSQLSQLALRDSESAENYSLLKSCHRRLAAEYSKPVAKRKNIAELEEKANALEKELARTVAGYGEAIRQVNWQEVQNALKPHEAAIEFVHFNYSNPDPTDSILYAALLLRPGWPQPRMVGLFEEKAIQPLLNVANNTQLYAARGDKKRGQTDKSEGIVVGIGESASLCQLIWQPFDSLLRGAKTVYFSPSGLLHRLNLAAVPIPGSDQVLGDRYKLVQLGSTRQLVVGSGSSSGSKTAALFGDLKYDAENQDTATATVTYDVAAVRRSLGARGGEAWDYLPGTEKEIQSVGKTLSKSGYSAQTFTGNVGSETAFKSLGTNNAPSPAVLHIATHGFFFPDPKDTIRNRQSAIGNQDPVFKTSDNPLMRSGLILAGANRAWTGGKTPDGQEDGILTAYEISQMNLSGTELVVLSACETGLGDVSGNEGVYGLQRAFKIAGAKYLIMSLWQVPDKQTSLLMTTFYKKWLEEKMEIPEAFRAAQKEMREQGFDPYQWAGFVLVE